MAYVCQLTDGTDTIDLMYNLTAGWTLLDQGIRVSRPAIEEIWGGRLQDQLVRREDGKRVIPLSLLLQGSSGVNLIDRVNALEEMLRHAARYRTEGWGDEVFLEFQIDDATHTVRFPVLSGEIDTSALMRLGREDHDKMEVPVILNCEAYWKDDSTYSLENYVDNPGWWRWAAAPGDSWAEVNAADVTSTQDTGIYEVMGNSLKMVIAPDAANDTGVQSDNITVVAETTYYFECRCYHTSGADDLTARVYDVSNGAVIAASVLTFDEQDDAWEKLGTSFDTPAGCVLVRVEIQRLSGDSSAGDKTYYVDAVYLTPGSTAPTGWSSGRNLSNHLDDDADHINVLCVTEIPGEVSAECQLRFTASANISIMRLGKRTRDDPHDFTWQLVPCAAYTTAEGGVGGACTPGFTNASCFDSDKIVDATSPSGSHIYVSFATQKDMLLRAYWRITGTDLASYQGKYSLVVLAKNDAVGATTDTIKINVRAYMDYPFAATHYQIDPTNQTCTLEVAGDWTTHDGWIIFSYPIGGTLGLWDTGNSWDIQLYASTDAPGVPTDHLVIAGAYLIPTDEQYCIAGNAGFTVIPSSQIGYLSNLDNHNGIFTYDTASSAYTGNFGYVGDIAELEPKIENWLYFIFQLNDTVDIDEGVPISLTYRPRGIFLRGNNP